MGGKVQATYHGTVCEVCGHPIIVNPWSPTGWSHDTPRILGHHARKGGGGASDPTPSTPPQQGAGVTSAEEQEQ